MIGITAIERNCLSRIQQIGFVRVGCWKLGGEQLRFELDDHGMAKNVLYAFVVSSRVMYVGKTVLPLNRRMYSYKKALPFSRATRGKNRFAATVQSIR